MAKYAEWCEGLEHDLAEPFPSSLIQQKRKGGSNISFVAWHAYAARLNDLVGSGWSVGELTMREVGGKLVTMLPLTIFGTTRVNVGSEDEDKDDFGDASTNSWAQAFKRSCALFGLGLSMYDKFGSVAKAREVDARAEHVEMLDEIKSAGASCAEEAEFLIAGKQYNVKAYIRENWSALKESATRARAVLDALHAA